MRRVRRTTPQQVVPIAIELHHVSMQRTHGVQGGTAIANIQRSWHRRRPVPPLAGNGSLRGAAAISEAQSPSLPSHHPSPGTAADGPPGRNDDLRDGASRRVPPPLQSDASLRRVGLGRSGSVDRRTKAGSARRCLEAGCSPTKNSPYPGGFERGVRPSGGAYPTKASSAFDAERGNRRPSLATLTCKATRATSNTSLASE